ncbi:MAG: DUF917 domain-containing protein [Pseudomonadota bacterium]
MKLGADSLDDLSRGAVFLATGGGGDPYVSLLATKHVLTTAGPADVIAAADLPDDAYVVTIGAVGAPSISLELLPSVNDPVIALDAFEKHVGRRVDAVVSFEIGGGNSLIPLAAAAGRGIPVIDGDGMGRALPEAQMMSYPIAGVAPTPAVGVDYAGNLATFQTDTTTTYERHIRAMAVAMGGMITTVEHPMSGATLKEAVIPGTLTFAIELGRLLERYRGNAHQIVAPLRDLFAPSLYGELFHLYTGKVVDYASRMVGGYDVGEARIEAFDRDAPPLTLSIRNEYLLATIGGTVVASVPDLITVLDFETSVPINAERLRYGQRVTVLATGCPAFYREPRALAVVAPRCFGFDIDYVPVEALTDSHVFAKG